MKCSFGHELIIKDVSYQINNCQKFDLTLLNGTTWNVSIWEKGKVVRMKKRHSVEQIIRILREAENGLRGLDVARKHNISEQTLCRWKKKYGEINISEARRMKLLENENLRLKKKLMDVWIEIPCRTRVASNEQSRPVLGHGLIPSISACSQCLWRTVKASQRPMKWAVDLQTLVLILRMR